MRQSGRTITLVVLSPVIAPLFLVAVVVYVALCFVAFFMACLCEVAGWKEQERIFKAFVRWGFS